MIKLCLIIGTILSLTGCAGMCDAAGAFATGTSKGYLQSNQQNINCDSYTANGFTQTTCR